ncbi:MAG: L-aspartate oxidase [Pseudomonadales bacterium]
MTLRFSTDVLVIGSGAAGLATALHLSPHARVMVLSKDDIRGGSTNRAQGGVAAVSQPADSVDAHVRDTVIAGAGLCNEKIVRYVVSRARQAIEHIQDLGLKFDQKDNGPHLTQEGGHTHRRVLHVADATGHAIATTLINCVLSDPKIKILTKRIAIDVATGGKQARNNSRTLGAYVYSPETGNVEVIEARYIVLATGGASKVYQYTSNPDGSTGDGIAMAWRAGCRIANMEFNQFHPTCLYHPDARSFLISEAIRGEGGKLVLQDGERFMERFDPRGEMAPRDVVARAIDFEMKRLGRECVYLDVTHLPDKKIMQRFPNILETCLSVGIDMRRDPIPVVPAAHYTCGGVLVDERGKTDVDGLYAVGETAYTGLHGANRLASNSLLECLVFARSVADDIANDISDAQGRCADIPDWDESRVTDSDENVILSHNWSELRRCMWNYVGIVRTNKRLERAARRIGLLKQEVRDYYSNYRVNSDLIELRNLIHVAELMVQAAQSRRESRGLHYTLDYPQTQPDARPSILYPVVDPLDVLQPINRQAKPSKSP